MLISTAVSSEGLDSSLTDERGLANVPRRGRVPGAAIADIVLT
jgi:hypothetical protein